MILPLMLALLAGVPALAPQKPEAPALVAPSDAVAFTDPELTLGDVAAPVTVVEYLSDTCAHCAAFDSTVFDSVRADYIDKGRLRYVVREMPSAPVAVAAAGFLLARCAGRDQYWPTVRLFLKNISFILAGEDTTGRISRLEEVSGTPPLRATACLSDRAAVDALNARRQAGLEAGVEATPTFVFNGVVLRPGDRLGASVYEGGELTRAQFAAAYSEAVRRLNRGGRGQAGKPGLTPAEPASRVRLGAR